MAVFMISSLRYRICLASSLLVVFGGCSGRTAKVDDGSSTTNSPTTTTSSTVVVEHPEGDPSVPAELGGPGFTGEGWTTATPERLGDPAAVKGGTMLSHMPAWPDNLRVYGIKSNTFMNSIVEGLCYGSLLSLHPQTMEFIPDLATHWKISEDKMIFSFRINPKAHWSDGTPVTADDVRATYRLIADDTLLDPMSKEAIVNTMLEPVARSKYIVEIKCREKNWRNFITFAGMTLLPAHQIGEITGESYLDVYNFKYTVVNGPYIVYDADIKTDESITITRRNDYWNAENARYHGLYNFDKIRFVVIREDRLAFDKACKGELDFYNVNVAKWWVEDLPVLEATEKGHLVRRKVYTKFPKGYQGQAVNMRDPLLVDVKVRKAMAHLYDRKTMLEKFAYNEYIPLKSYFPNSDAANPDNELVEYDPGAAVRLLAESGWSERGSDGILIKDGNRFSVKLTYRSEFFEKYLTVYQEACKQAGVELRLQQVDPSAMWDAVQHRKFQVSGMAWGASMFPSPKLSWYSTMADQDGSNNITGLQSAEADAVIDEYDKQFDLQKRNQLLRRLDGIMFNTHPYILDWYLPCQRFMYWNKFGTPKTVLYKYQDWRSVFSLWWVDAEKEKQLRAARKSGGKLPIMPVDVDPWSDETLAAAK